MSFFGKVTINQLFGKIAGQTSMLQTTQPLEEQLSHLSAAVAQLVQGQQEGPVDDQLHQKMEALKEKCLRLEPYLDENFFFACLLFYSGNIANMPDHQILSRCVLGKSYHIAMNGKLYLIGSFASCINTVS